MAYKIYTKGNYFILDDIENNIQYEGLKKDVVVTRRNDQSESFNFLNLFGWDNQRQPISITEILDENENNYTLNSFITFYRENTGNFSGGGTAPTTWGNITGTIEEQDDLILLIGNAVDVKQDKFYSNKVTTPSNTVTGTLDETQAYKISINPDTFKPSDIIRFPSILITRTTTIQNATVRLKISTSPTMPLGTIDQIAQFNAQATNLYQQVNRIFYVNGGQLKGFPFTTSQNTDSLGTTAMSTRAFDVTQRYYLYVSITLGSTSDSVRIEGLYIMNS